MYDYITERPKVFTIEGQQMIFKIYDMIRYCVTISGCVDLNHATKSVDGDSWLMMACIDRLIEMGKVVEVEQSGSTLSQHRIFKLP